ncbi:MAG: phosphatase PAP2 family protein [Chloroflexi bacterium]|nr:phosphatase PAP2 family protein [Chloroflexota bacterium]
MESLFEFGLSASRWWQTNYPQLAPFFQWISQLGRFEFYLAVTPLIYWCINKQMGKHLIFLLAFSDIINSITKQALHQPRPYWLDAGLGLDEESSYGIPSGHAQGASLMYLFLGLWLRRSWVWVLCLTMVVLMALSRVYLGVHFVHDVVGGFLIAVLVLVGYAVWQRDFYDRFRNRILGQRVMFILVVIFLLALLFGVTRLVRGVPDMGVVWAQYIEVAELESVENVATAFGTLLGVGIGFILEVSWVRFKEQGVWWKKVLRYGLGMAVAAAIVFGLRAILPTEPLWLGHIPLRIFRYFLGGFWVSYYAPALFVRLKLAEAHPEPEIKFTVSNEGLMQQ